MASLQDILKAPASRGLDHVSYSIYFPPLPTKAETLTMLQEKCSLIQSELQPMVDSYLWQKDRFGLTITYAAKNDPPYAFLHGASRFGDCMNDEWFIIYLLYHVSRVFLDAVVAIADNDGDVLLIEAALNLPSWLDPSNSGNRVYVYQGDLHIIPLPSTPADIAQIPGAGKLQRKRAIELVRHDHIVSRANDDIQQPIRDRLREYPEAAKDEIHRARCILPKEAAFVLLQEPQLLTLAIEAFYLRDPVALKACASMRKFSPAKNNNVKATIPFTKITYAQTVSQKFYPPKPFRLPPVSSKREHAIAELGMKLTCGLEMLYHDELYQTCDTDGVSDSNLERNPQWKDFCSRLSRLGYFRNELPGSRLYKELESRAKQQFLEKPQHVNTESDTEEEDEESDTAELFTKNAVFGRSSPRSVMDGILKDFSEDLLHQLLLDNANESEDSDDWLKVDPEQLEALLQQRTGKVEEHELKEHMSVDLEKMMANFEQFVEGSKSGVDGVHFPGEKDDLGSDSGSEYDGDDYESDESGDNEGVSFDTESFMKILMGTLGSSDTSAAHPERDLSEQLTDMMEQMDKEISTHDKINASFTRNKSEVIEETEDGTDEEDENAPVDVQLNLVKNVLESFKSQQGLPGPVGNILGQFGIVLPADNEEEEHKDTV